MGKLALYRYASLMMLIIQIVAAIFTIIGLFGGNSNPSGHTASAMLVFALPLLIVANIVLLAYWLIRRQWIIAALPAIVILASIPYAGTMLQLRRLPADAADSNAIKVATYNVAMFGRHASGFIAQDILSEMRQENVDIICFQEYNDDSGDALNSDSYKDFFPFMAKGNDDMVIYSRFPITAHKHIPFDNSSGSALIADIKVGNETVRIVNAHLQTTGINRTLRQAAKTELEGGHIEGNALMAAIYGNYTKGMVMRASQAETVAGEIAQSPYPVVLCGDFNDVPYSYVYTTMKGALRDGFRECGSGWMYTFRGSKSVRIDYIFHSTQLQGIKYYKKNLTYSDHYPVFMQMAL